MLQRADHVANITLEKLVGAKEKYGSEFAIPEVRISWDIGTIQDNGQERGFCEVFILGSQDNV